MTPSPGSARSTAFFVFDPLNANVQILHCYICSMRLFLSHWQGLAGATSGAGRGQRKLFREERPCARAAAIRGFARNLISLATNYYRVRGYFESTVTRPSKMTPTAKTQDACMTASPLPASAGPDSSLTGTYLNQFNEMVKLIEQLPNTPELIDDILNWHP